VAHISKHIQSCFRISTSRGLLTRGKWEETEESFHTKKLSKKYGSRRILHPLNPKHQEIELSDKKQSRIVGWIMEKKRY